MRIHYITYYVYNTDYILRARGEFSVRCGWYMEYSDQLAFLRFDSLGYQCQSYQCLVILLFRGLKMHSKSQGLICSYCRFFHPIKHTVSSLELYHSDLETMKTDQKPCFLKTQLSFKSPNCLYRKKPHVSF